MVWYRRPTTINKYVDSVYVRFVTELGLVPEVHNVDPDDVIRSIGELVRKCVGNENVDDARIQQALTEYVGPLIQAVNEELQNRTNVLTSMPQTAKIQQFLERVATNGNVIKLTQKAGDGVLDWSTVFKKRNFKQAARDIFSYAISHLQTSKGKIEDFVFETVVSRVNYWLNMFALLMIVYCLYALFTDEALNRLARETYTANRTRANAAAPPETQTAELDKFRHYMTVVERGSQEYLKLQLSEAILQSFIEKENPFGNLSRLLNVEDTDQIARKVRLLLHPDKNRDVGDEMKEIFTEAFKQFGVLNDEFGSNQKRASSRMR